MFASLLYFIGLGAVCFTTFVLNEADDEKVGFTSLVAGIGFILYSFAYYNVTKV